MNRSNYSFPHAFLLIHSEVLFLQEDSCFSSSVCLTDANRRGIVMTQLALVLLASLSSALRLPIEQFPATRQITNKIRA